MTSTDTITRAEQACAELLADHQPVTFTQVAIRSGLGRTTLYRNPALRALIEEHRNRSAGVVRGTRWPFVRRDPQTPHTVPTMHNRSSASLE